MALKELSFTYGDVTPKNIVQLRKLNENIFPVRYSDKFYNTDVLNPEHKEITKLCMCAPVVYSIIIVLHNDVVIGAVCCRIEAVENQKRIYIMTLGLLAPYRGYKIGSRVLQMVIDYAKKHDIASILLHVQTSNEEAVQFYSKYDFKISETVEKYYSKIEPTSAYILTKSLNN